MTIFKFAGHQFKLRGLLVYGGPPEIVEVMQSAIDTGENSRGYEPDKEAWALLRLFNLGCKVEVVSKTEEGEDPSGVVY